MRVHPAADIFPMVPDDGLQSLAESIKANGLRFPIVRRKIGDEWEVIDGRNRLHACKIAGVEPTFTEFDGDDDAVLAFIADVNLQRRDLKKTQKAALYARMYPDPAKRGPKGLITGNNQLSVNSINEEFVNSDNFYKAQLSKCRAVGKYSSTLLADIINDRIPLETAFKEAQDALVRSNSVEAKTAHLRERAPDLADLVADERMALSEAMAALEQRESNAAAEEQNKRETILRLSEAAYRGTVAWASDPFIADVVARLSDLEFRKQLLERTRFDSSTGVENLRKGAEAIAAVLIEISGTQS